jgi:hypothetical protein
MVARLLLWNLADTATSVTDLRALRLPASPTAIQEVWLADDATDRWGSFALFRDAGEASEPLPPRVRELLGKDPDVFELFDVRA